MQCKEKDVVNGRLKGRNIFEWKVEQLHPKAGSANTLGLALLALPHSQAFAALCWA
jgi:hypothetical protein